MISVTILVKNGERKLKQVLEKLEKFNEVILVDTGSTDNTLTIAKQFSNAIIFKNTFQGFGPMRNLAATYAKNSWILALDADEVLSDALVNELFNLPLDSRCVYNFNYRNYFNGKWIKGCGWYPESHIRLYDKTRTSFSEKLVHENVISEGHKIITLKNPIYHYSYEEISDFLRKMEHYSTLFAKENKGKKKSNPLIAFGHGLGAFLKGYFYKRGFLDGYEGFLISSYNAQTAFYKYLKLYHLNHSDP